MSVVRAEIVHGSVSTKLLKGGDIKVRGSEMLYFLGPHKPVLLRMLLNLSLKGRNV